VNDDILTFQEVRKVKTWSDVKFGKTGRPRNMNRRLKRARRCAEKLNRFPVWSDRKLIREIYCFCPEDYTVDHTVPMRGKLVSGLHVPNNLRYMKAVANFEKKNDFVPHREQNGRIVEYYEHSQI